MYDGENILLEYDGTNTLLARYSHGERRDKPFSVERGGQSFFYQADHEGSVTQVTDAAGFVVNSYEYDAYGRIESSIEGIANPFTYTGREQDPESGLYYYRARYYDPEIGRFLNEDPLGFTAGDANLYRYVFNNPVNLTDPDGMQAAPPMPMPGLPFPIPPIAIPGSPENEAWTNAVVTLMGKISKKFKDIFGGSRPDIPHGDAIGRGKWVCVALCPTEPASPGCTCPPWVSGTGYGKTAHEASVNAQESANNIVPTGCKGKHCKVQCWKASGPQGR